MCIFLWMLWITPVISCWVIDKVFHSFPVEILSFSAAYPLFHSPYDYDNYFF